MRQCAFSGLTLFCSYIIRTLLYLPFPLSMPCVQITLQWPLCASHFLHGNLTQYILSCTVMGVAQPPIWFIRTLFSVELTYEGKIKQYIPLSISVCSWTNCMKDQWAHSGSLIQSWQQKKVTVTLPVALKKASWNYWTVQKGITNGYDLLVLPTHTEIWVGMILTQCTLWLLECER